MQKTFKVISGSVAPVGRKIARLGECFTADDSNPGIKVLVAGKRIELVTEAEAGGKVSRSPKTIDDLSPRECKSLIAGEADREVLESWAKDEQRTAVKKFLADRLRELKA